MEDLEEKWKDLKLRDEEKMVIEIDEEVPSDLLIKEQRTLLEKFCSNRLISKEVVENTLAKVWRISKQAQFTEVSPNIFAIVLDNIANKQKVWSGRPWLFDNQLLVLKEFDGFTPLKQVNFNSESFWVRFHNLPLSCMMEVRGEQIGSTVGRVERVDVQEDGSGWGKFLRVQIHIDLNQPLTRGRTLMVKGKDIWIPFSYEKMPRICFLCGCIKHGQDECKEGGSQAGGDNQYGQWLRATQVYRNNFFMNVPKRSEEGNKWWKEKEYRHQGEGSRGSNKEEGCRDGEGSIEGMGNNGKEQESVTKGSEKTKEGEDGVDLDMGSDVEGGNEKETIAIDLNDKEEKMENGLQEVEVQLEIMGKKMDSELWNKEEGERVKRSKKGKIVQDLCSMTERNKPNLVFIMETKLRYMKSESIKRRIGSEGCFTVEAVGKGGGLILLWDSSLNLEIVNYSQGHISAWVMEEAASKWLLICFYGAPETTKRKDTWSMLKSLKPKGDEGWMIVGDFNEILTEDEKWGGKARPESQMELFREVMSESDLQDLGWRGEKFTRSNSHTDSTFTKERLDRAVANSKWMEMYNEAWVDVLVARTSDHKPLLVHLIKQDKRGDTQGRQKAKNFKYEASWALEDECEMVLRRAWGNNGSLNQNVIGLLNNSKRAFQVWSKMKKQRNGKEVEEKTKLLQRLQAEESSENVEEIRKLTTELHALLEKEDLWWKQRAKTNWYKHGDRNTKYFHACANQRRKRNFINEVEDDNNNMACGYIQVEEAFRKYFGNVFQSTQPSKAEIEACLVGMDRRVTEGMNERLTRRFTVVEVEKAVKQMAPLKAPGPDGFGLCFYWAWFKGALAEIISPKQSAFLPGRLINDNIMVAYELLHSMRNRKKEKVGSMAMKLDMSKAYDRVEWQFLEAVLFKLGFCTQWVDLVMKCVKTASYSVLINGTPGKKFWPSRGLRQGDPLSPYLFIVCAEGLSSLLDYYEKRQMIKRVQVARGGTSINHLLFADDCILFGRTKIEEWRRIQRALQVYEKASGQFLNKEKTAVFFSKNSHPVDKQAIKEAGQNLVCGIYEKYLGLPAIVGRSKFNTFRSLKERIWQKIVSWKNKFLSQVGKEEERGMIWRNWERLSVQKGRGGMGFRDLESFNTALLAKQEWRILKYPLNLATVIFREKYFRKESFMEAKLGSQPSLIWRSIWSARNLLKEGLRWRVGDGKEIKIWGSKWVPSPISYAVQSPVKLLKEDAKVEELINVQKGEWDEAKIRAIFVPEEAEKILSVPLSSRGTKDKLIWGPSKKGIFSIRSAYFLLLELRERNQGECSVEERNDDRWNKIWELKVPGVTKLFIWRAANNLLPTKENLYKRKVIEEKSCLMCEVEEETIMHVLWECPAANNLWGNDESCVKKWARSESNFMSLWEKLMDRLHKNQLEEMTVLLRKVWLRRNDWIFEKRMACPKNSFSATKAALHEFRDSQGKRMGIGIMIRDEQGEAMVTVCDQKPNVIEVAVAESIALRKAVEICADILTYKGPFLKGMQR
ncbi:uncharacterized protein LOC122293492 [Carya illinoinensis]|uniref:uncharacterized protein LOC122293492 n=1 Tax=Carya illinoinensis TaxID=32201 RepID=UPI001C7279AA|nr:uncharacterized protein LOC122293492 [Carya illinoinensis]